MTQLLMPKATAVWLIDNTALSFDQIADLCSLHPLEVQSIADGETGIGIQGYDPVQNGQLTREEIEKQLREKFGVGVHDRQGHKYSSGSQGLAEVVIKAGRNQLKAIRAAAEDLGRRCP